MGLKNHSEGRSTQLEADHKGHSLGLSLEDTFFFLTFLSMIRIRELSALSESWQILAN